MSYLTYNELQQPSDKTIYHKAMDVKERERRTSLPGDVKDHPSRNMPSSSYWNYTHDVPQPTYTPEGIPRGNQSMAAMEEHHWEASEPRAQRDNMELHNSEVNTN